MGRHIPVKIADAPPWAAELTIRERAFVDQFIIDLNGAAAAQRANVGGKNSKSAGQIASKMRKRLHRERANRGGEQSGRLGQPTNSLKRTAPYGGAREPHLRRCVRASVRNR
jgi:hypothetical protein